MEDNKSGDELIEIDGESIDVIDVVGDFSNDVDEFKKMVLNDSRMCHFVADLIAGKCIDEAVDTHFRVDNSLKSIDEATIEKTCGELGWDLEHWESVNCRVKSVCDEIASVGVTQDSLLLMCRGLTYDDAMIDAEQRGYVKGRNEKIELVKREVNGADVSRANIVKKDGYKSILENPRRSIWDE